MGDAKDKAGDALDDVKDKAGDALDDAKDKAGDAWDDAKDKLGALKDKVDGDDEKETARSADESTNRSTSSARNHLRQRGPHGAPHRGAPLACLEPVGRPPASFGQTVTGWSVGPVREVDLAYKGATGTQGRGAGRPGARKRNRALSVRQRSSSCRALRCRK